MKLLTLIAALFLGLGITASAGAQTIDARWAPFIGCWELIDGGASTCVAPAAPGAVTLSTSVEGKQVLEQTIIADGTAHPVTEEGCSGSQTAEWSRDGRKLFTRADLTCANQPVRTVTGLTLLTGDSSWLDVQAVNIAQGTSVRIRKYRRAQGQPSQPQPLIDAYFGAAPFTIDDVIEANTKVSSAVLEAVLAETGARFPLRARELVNLDDAGVPGTVIDLMIANSFPARFQVERRAAARVDTYSSYGPGWSSSYWGLGYPYFYSYPGYYVNYRDYYSPYGYAYPGSYYYYPGSVRDGGGDADADTPQDGDGRVVNGVGYTRVRTREATATTRSESGSGSSSSGSSSGRGAMTPSGATQSSSGSSSSGSSGSSSSGGGSSSNSGGSDSGRTAQPR